MTYITFGEKLKQYRLSKDLSLQELADILGTSKQVLSRYERGENMPKLETVISYCEKLGVDFETLAGLQKTDDSDAIIRNMVAKELSGLSDHELQDVAEYIYFLKSKRR